MTTAYKIDPKNGCIFIKCRGALTALDTIAFNDGLAQDPDYRPGLNRLVDLRGAKYDADAGDIKGVTAELISARDDNEGDRQLALLARGEFDFAQLQMIAAFASPSRTEARTFLIINEAVSWLGLPPEMSGAFDGWD